MTNQLLAELEMANKKIEEKDKEIDRLNNMINELEKWLNENWNKPLAKIYVADVVKKISELKENK